jgi:FlaG/FlaF family flagellin (archaellin)
MNYLKRIIQEKGEDAVSPVVGVMLMLFVTVIIAAVVSAFAGGLSGGGSQAAPTVSLDVQIINTGSSSGSGFFATVTSVSNPVKTQNLKLITAWSTTNRTNNQMINGGNMSAYMSGSTVDVPPLGYGPGITDGITNGDNFGNYTLEAGTGLAAAPDLSYGNSSLSVQPYQYQSSPPPVDDISKVLGTNWQNLKEGDIVTVTLVDVSSGKTIYQKSIPVTEG